MVKTSPGRLSLFVFLLGAALMGVLFGTLIFCYANDNTLSSLISIREGFIDSRLTDDFGGQLLRSFGTGALFMLAVFLLGLCALGQPFTVLVVIYRAVGIGAAAASVFSAYGKQGLRETAFLLMPEGAAGLLILILAARESVSMSGIVFRTLLSDNNSRHMADITRLYSVKMLVLLACTGMAALFQSVMTIIYKMLFTA